MDPATSQKVEKLRRQHKQGLVVGLKDISGVINRQDIDALICNDPKVFNLFLLGFKEFQETHNSDIMGYFQIAGIHGWPKQRWNGVEGKNMKTADDAGYCAHGTPTFGTWHRPYLAMFEQAIFIHMIDIADKYTDPQVRAEYQAAALRFRLPYWDYFRPRGGKVYFPGVRENNGSETSYEFDYKAPIIFTQKEVMVRMYPDNVLQKLEKNPLNFFIFSNHSGTFPTAEWQFLRRKAGKNPNLDLERTNRHPEGASFDNPERLNSVLNELRMDSNRYVLNMICGEGYEAFDRFSSAGWDNEKVREGDNPQTREFTRYGSLEAIHGLYHNLCGGTSGGGGHMSFVATAAFDPIFWFHHNQIERFFTIWQKIHERESNTNWFVDRRKAAGDLSPFMRPENSSGEKFWTSNSARRSTDFGYSYEDVQADPVQTRDEFEKLYRWSVPRKPKDKVGKVPDRMKWLDVLKTEFFKTGSEDERVSGASTPATKFSSSARQARAMPVSPPMDTKVTQTSEREASPPNPEDEEVYDWFIDDKVERMALNGSFSILYFINYEAGLSFDDRQDLGVAPTLAGITHVFAAPREGCDNCGRQAEQAVIVSDTSPITSQLFDYMKIGLLSSMRPEHVKPFLIDRLRWRVIDGYGETIDPRVMARDHSLQIGISAKVTRDNTQPEVSVHNDIIDSIIQNAS